MNRENSPSRTQKSENIGQKSEDKGPKTAGKGQKESLGTVGTCQEDRITKIDVGRI
jgi:hypothetical protein